MSKPLTAPRRGRAAILATAASLVAAATGLPAGSANAGTLSGSLYRDPDGAVVEWVTANSTDSRMPQIRDRIASQPSAKWLSNVNLTTVQSEVSGYIGAANAANQIPLLSVYGIPNRDCGGASAGGAPTMAAYQQWISSISHGLGNRLVIIVLETDSIALQSCLSASDLAARNQVLTTAVQTLKGANSNAKVYLDGGHSAWNGASDQANRLRAAGIQYADGFFTNVSNFQSTANEAAYGRGIISALNSGGVSGKHQLIDTSRNGGAAGDWCADDNADRRIGQYPTLDTGDPNIDGYLWVKPPGEADGCAFAAGSFQPGLAYSLSTGVADPPATTTPPVTTTATTTLPVTGACSASYTTLNSWPGGFQGQVTVQAGSAAINGWTVSWTLTSGQQITQLWNGALTVNGSAVTVKSYSWNGSLPANGTTTFGFLGSPDPFAPSLACATP